jgi:hypothetical protein
MQTNTCGFSHSERHMEPCAVRFKLLLKSVLDPELNEIFTSNSPQTLVVGCVDLFPPTSPETLEKQTQRFNPPKVSKDPWQAFRFLRLFPGPGWNLQRFYPTYGSVETLGFFLVHLRTDPGSGYHTEIVFKLNKYHCYTVLLL